MNAVKSLWIDWERMLQRFNMKQLAAMMLEGSGPLPLLLAQLVHFGQPFLGSMMPDGKWEEIADMLDDEPERLAFAAFLKGDSEN